MRNTILSMSVNNKYIKGPEFGNIGNLAIQSQSGHLDKLDRLPIRHRQSSRLAGTDRTYIYVRLRFQSQSIFGITKHLGLGFQFHVDFHADDWGVFGHKIVLFSFLSLTKN